MKKVTDFLYNLLLLLLLLKPKSISSPHNQTDQKHDDSHSHSEDDGGGGGTIKRCPVPETPSPAKPASYVPPRPPPPKLPPHRRSSLGNESPKLKDVENSATEDDGSFRHFWEWLHTPHTEEELEEAWEVLKEVKEEQEKQEEKKESKSSWFGSWVVSADPVVPCDWLCGLPLVFPCSLIYLFHDSINSNAFFKVFICFVSSVHQLTLNMIVCL